MFPQFYYPNKGDVIGLGSLHLKKKVCGFSSILSSDIAKRNHNFNYDISRYTSNFDDGKCQQEKFDFYSYDNSLLYLFKCN